MLDSTNLPVILDHPSIPIWVEESVRRGARISLDLLRASELPRAVVVTQEPSALSALGLDDPEADPLTAMDSGMLAISYRSALDPAYIGTPSPSVEAQKRTLSFLAGFISALWVAESQPSWAGEAPWLAIPEGGVGVDALSQAATAVASIASGFTMVGADCGEDPQRQVVRFFLMRLAQLVAEDGPGAVWRAGVGHASRAMIREVRFRETPWKVGPFGERISESSDLLHLVRYAEGAGPWPFSPRTS